MSEDYIDKKNGEGKSFTHEEGRVNAKGIRGVDYQTVEGKYAGEGDVVWVRYSPGNEVIKIVSSSDAQSGGQSVFQDFGEALKFPKGFVQKQKPKDKITSTPSNAGESPDSDQAEGSEERTLAIAVAPQPGDVPRVPPVGVTVVLPVGEEEGRDSKTEENKLREAREAGRRAAWKKEEAKREAALRALRARIEEGKRRAAEEARGSITNPPDEEKRYAITPPQKQGGDPKTYPVRPSPKLVLVPADVGTQAKISTNPYDQSEKVTNIPDPKDTGILSADEGEGAVTSEEESEDIKNELLSEEQGADLCGVKAEKQTVSEYCPKRPKQKNGGDCVSPDSNRDIKKRALDRHGPEWKEFILNEVLKASKENDVDPALLMAMIESQGGFNPMSTSKGKTKHYGIAQFQLGAAQDQFVHLVDSQAESSKIKKLFKGKSDTFIRNSVTNKKPINCESAFNDDCRESIRENCKNLEDKGVESLGNAGEETSLSLYCPQFSLQLMASHIKRIKEESRPYKIEGTDNEVDLANILRGGDRVTEVRYIASRYSRGGRIFNSAVHHMVNNKCSPLSEQEVENVNKCLPTSKKYGELWATKRPDDYKMQGSTKDKDKNKNKNKKIDPFYGGNLDGHDTNRCYLWRVAGICGGSKDSAIDYYTNMLCNERKGHVKGERIDETQQGEGGTQTQ